jgi:anti-sigma B factor antagonist
MNARPYLGIVTEHHGQRSVVRLRGELDVSNRHLVRDAIASALERHPSALTIDLSELSFIDCAGLSVLVWAHNRLAGHGPGLVLAGGTPIVRQLLRLTGLDAFLHVRTPEALDDDPDEGVYV